MIRVGLIGLGYWGPNLARSLELTGQAKVVALCDADESRHGGMGARYPDARTTVRAEELIEADDLDALAIATPVSSHYALAAAALKAGKHVLVEKPITLTSDQALALYDLAASAGRVLLVGHVFEYNATLEAVRDLIRRGELGDVHYLHLERTNLGPVRVDVNALYDLASHDVSIIRYLLGRPPATVSARGQSYLNPGTEDVVFATFGMGDGTLAHVHASWLNPTKVRQITVVGSEKMLRWDDLDLKTPVQLFDKRVEVSGLSDPSTSPDTFIAHKTALVDGGMVAPRVQANEPLKAECAHFLACVRGEAQPRSSGRSGFHVVRALEAATASMEQGSAIQDIDYAPLGEELEAGS